MEGLQRLQSNPLYHLVGEIFFLLLTVGNNRCYLLCGGKKSLEEDVLGDYLSQFSSKMTRLANCLLSHWHIK